MPSPFLQYKHQCTRCQIPAIGGADTGLFVCPGCLRGDDVVRLRVPYITSLAFQEMYTAGWGHTLIAERDRQGGGTRSSRSGTRSRTWWRGSRCPRACAP